MCVFVDADSTPKLFVLTEQGQKLNHVMSTMAADTAGICCAECSMEDNCVAASFNNRDGICNLNDRNPLDFPQISSTPDSAWMSFGREVKCPGPGWAPYNRTCYKAVGQSMNWNTARDYCASIDAYLVDIMDAMEGEFVRDVASAEAQRIGSKTIYWIGLHIVSYRTHDWVSGAPYTYSNWWTACPSYVAGNGAAENCIQAGPSVEWNDVRCSKH